MDYLPDVERSLELFLALDTQWRVGPSGLPIGLVYSDVLAVMRLRAVPRAEWRELFADVQTMEQAALAVMHKQTIKGS